MSDWGSRFSGSPLTFIARGAGAGAGWEVGTRDGPFDSSELVWNTGDCGWTISWVKVEAERSCGGRLALRTSPSFEEGVFAAANVEIPTAEVSWPSSASGVTSRKRVTGLDA
jgi:hypothetical protein